MSIWKHRKPSGIIYVFEAQKYWDENAQKYKYKQKCIGKIDPDTGEIVPNAPKTGPHPGSKLGKRSNNSRREIEKLTLLYGRAEERVVALRAHIKELDEENHRQFKRLDELTTQVQQLTQKLNLIRSIASLTPISENSD